jgi:hypothetical protein
MRMTRIEALRAKRRDHLIVALVLLAWTLVQSTDGAASGTPFLADPMNRGMITVHGCAR